MGRCRSDGAFDICGLVFYKHVAPLALGTERGRSRARSASPDHKTVIEPPTALPVHALRTGTVRAPRSVWSARGFSTAFGRDTVVRGMRVRGMTLFRNASDFIPLTMIPLTELAVGNAT